MAKRRALFRILGYLNGESVTSGSAFGREDADLVASEMQDKQSSLTVGIYNRETGQLVKTKKPRVCRSGKNF